MADVLVVAAPKLRYPIAFAVSVIAAYRPFHIRRRRDRPKALPLTDRDTAVALAGIRRGVELGFAEAAEETPQ